MKRTAIIIGSPLDKNSVNYLKGVYNDYDSMITFLKTPSGGAWQNIKKRINPTKQSVLNAISDTYYDDYVFLYFSGHGSYDGKDTILQLNDKERTYLSDILPDNRKCLVIVDACRKYTPYGYRNFIGEIKKSFSSKLTKDYARKLFNQSLIDSDDGLVIAYAASVGEFSWESHSGGIFTDTLLYKTREWTETINEFKILSFNTVFLKVKKQVPVITKNFKQIQHPELSVENMRNYFPFAVKEKIKKFY